MKGEQDTGDIFVVWFFVHFFCGQVRENNIPLFTAYRYRFFFLEAFLISLFSKLNSLVRSHLPALHAFFFVLRFKKTFQNPVSSLVNTTVNLYPLERIQILAKISISKPEEEPFP